MKTKTTILLILFPFLFSFNCLMAQQGQKISENLFLSKVNDTVYIATHYFPWESNSMIFFSDGELVLIDTPYTNDATKEVCEWASKEFEIKGITAINTGFHVDNLGGNQYLIEQGIDIFGADAITKLLIERSNETQRQTLTWLEAPSLKMFYDEHAKMKFIAPNQTFKLEEGLTIKRGRLHYEIYFPGESHSPDNVTVYIPELDILFGGCMIKSAASKNLGFTGDANLEEWPKSVARVSERYPNCSMVVPHHGMWGGMELIEHTLQLFQTDK